LERAAKLRVKLRGTAPAGVAGRTKLRRVELQRATAVVLV
jgi:hypothetical protein